MIKSPVFLIILSFALLFSCTKTNHLADADGDTEIKNEYIEIGMGVLRGGGSENIPESNHIVRTADEWRTLLDQINAANPESDQFEEVDIDFSKYQVFAIFDDIRPSSGYGIFIERVVESESIQVKYLKSHPADSGFYLTIITQPFHIVKYPASDKEVTFENLNQ